MDMQVRSSADEGLNAQASELTYSWLYQQVQTWAEQSTYPKPSRAEKWSFRLGLLATGIGLATAALPSTVLPVRQAALVAFICLLVELGGFLTGRLLSTKRELRQLAKPRLSHAKEMDGEFAHWVTMIDTLRRFPRRQREERLRFVTDLRTGIIERIGLMYGGLQKLGPFPVLIALYLQFRDWKWGGGWVGAFDVNLVGGILIFAIRRFPRRQREERLRFVTDLRTGIIERIGLMYGGLQKLGPFPVLIALYLQFRDWKCGGWAGAFDVNLVGGILIFAIIQMYAAAWLMMAFRFRLDTYVNLLEAALRDQDGDGSSGTSGWDRRGGGDPS